MSHLTTLPTVLRDEDLLVAALQSLQLHPHRERTVIGFAGEQQPVAIQLLLPGDLQLGWQRQADGSLALVGDLERLSRQTELPALLAEITRSYAALLALREASSCLPEAVVHLHR